MQLRIDFLYALSAFICGKKLYNEFSAKYLAINKC